MFSDQEEDIIFSKNCVKKNPSTIKHSETDIFTKIEDQTDESENWMDLAVLNFQKSDSEVGHSEQHAKAKKQFGNVASFLYSAVDKAGKTVTAVGAKIKNAIEENSILAEINNEQNAYIENQQKITSRVVPPWIGCANEEAVRENFLSLSTDTRNFVRSPPIGANLQSDHDVYSAAITMMEQDPNLEKMRFELVPKVISEEHFWRNYFYRVSLICEANELSFVVKEDIKETLSDELSNFFYSAVNKANRTFTAAGTKIKKAIEDNGIFSDFNKEQEAFVKARECSTSDFPPWIGWENEEALKEKCLSLSTDQSNFTRNPPPGVDFQFDYKASCPIAIAVMEQDPNLKRLRFELVPKIVSEENFWKNYFYRVNLICRADFASVNPDEREEEFVPSAFQATKGLVEEQEDMKKLPFVPSRCEEEWEKELESELQDFVLSKNCNNWEKDSEDIFEEDVDLNKVILDALEEVH